MGFGGITQTNNRTAGDITPYGIGTDAQSKLDRDQMYDAARRASTQQEIETNTGLKARSATYGPDGSYSVQYGTDPNALFDRFKSIGDQWANGNGAVAGPQVSRDSGTIADQEAAARSASFARAKDQAGQVARGSLESLQDVLGGRNMLGSGLEAQQTASVINKGQGELGDASREQSIRDADNASHVADTEYSGAITQRGQNITAQQSQLQSLMALYKTAASLY